MSDLSQNGKDALILLSKARDAWHSAKASLLRAERDEESTRRRFLEIETSLKSTVTEYTSGISVIITHSGIAELVTVTSKGVTFQELPTVEVP